MEQAALLRACTDDNGEEPPALDPAGWAQRLHYGEAVMQTTAGVQFSHAWMRHTSHTGLCTMFLLEFLQTHTIQALHA